MSSVLIDGRQLSGESSHSGIGHYVQDLIESLVAFSPLHVKVLATRDVLVPPGAERVNIQRFTDHGRLAVYEHEMRRLLDTRRHRADLFHNPNPHAPVRAPRPWVQTLHDVIPLVIDDPELAASRRRWERFGPRYAKADAVVAISQHAADEGISRLGIDPSKVTVIHHGVNRRYRPSGKPPDEDPPYLSLVAEYSQRKGHREAYEIIAGVADAGLPHRLRVAGRIPPWEVVNFNAELERARRRDRIDVLGFVDDLVSLYQGATAHLVTSHYEGFGLPAVEAMACGTPVVAFSTTATTEVVADGGILVPANDVGGAVSAVLPLLTDETCRRHWSGVAIKRSWSFSWASAATAYAELFTSLIP